MLREKYENCKTFVKEHKTEIMTGVTCSILIGGAALIGFSHLKNELKNSSLFGKLLYSGVPLKTAFEVIHKDEIIGGAMSYTAQKVREQVVKGIEAKGRRPLENGIASESGIVTVTDVNALTSKDILKILKQVENGANIKF